MLQWFAAVHRLLSSWCTWREDGAQSTRDGDDGKSLANAAFALKRSVASYAVVKDGYVSSWASSEASELSFDIAKETGTITRIALTSPYGSSNGDAKSGTVFATVENTPEQKPAEPEKDCD